MLELQDGELKVLHQQEPVDVEHRQVAEEQPGAECQLEPVDAGLRPALGELELVQPQAAHSSFCDRVAEWGLEAALPDQSELSPRQAAMEQTVAAPEWRSAWPLREPQAPLLPEAESRPHQDERAK